MFLRSYTLVELVSVMAIFLILLTIGVVRFGALHWGGSPVQAAEEFRRLAALCRRRAAATGEECRIVFVPAERRFRCGEEQMVYPEGICFLRNGGEVRTPGAVLCFYPDGCAAETLLAFESEGVRATLLVSPLTGSMEIHEPE